MTVREWLQAACDTFVNQGFWDGFEESDDLLASDLTPKISTFEPNASFSCCRSPTATIACGASLNNRLATRWTSAVVTRFSSLSGVLSGVLYVSAFNQAS